MRPLGLACLIALTLSLEALAEPPPRRVVVTNFPNPQNVAGAVEVTNLPAVQDVNVVNTPPSGSARFQLVGFTAAQFNGAQGVLGFTLACQQEFPRSRMCSSLEILETTTVPSGLVGDAWVRPSPEGLGGAWSDVSGAGPASPADLTCRGWSLATPMTQPGGLVVDAAGRFSVGTYPTGPYCDTPHSVACCALVP